MMKTLFHLFIALSLSAGLCAGASASQPVGNADVSEKLEKLDATVQIIDSRLQQILIQLNRSAQTGVCWLDGKAWSQGAGATVKGQVATCGVQPNTGWPQWTKADVKAN